MGFPGDTFLFLTVHRHFTAIVPPGVGTVLESVSAYDRPRPPTPESLFWHQVHE